MKNIHIADSYLIWDITSMQAKITAYCSKKFNSADVEKCLNRSLIGIYIEWWIHNIGYYLTLPFIKNEKIKALNERFKHVDLEEHK